MSVEMIDNIGVLALFATCMVLITVFFICEIRDCNEGMRSLKQIEQELTEMTDDTAECGGCTYWDGATCMNPQSRSYGRETDDGCEVKEGEDRAD